MDIFLFLLACLTLFSTMAVFSAYLWWQDAGRATLSMLFLGVLLSVVTSVSQEEFLDPILFWLILAFSLGIVLASLIGGLWRLFTKKAFEKMFWFNAGATSFALVTLVIMALLTL